MQMDNLHSLQWYAWRCSCSAHCCRTVPVSMSLIREALVLPTVKIPIAAPVNPQQQLRISLLDSSKRLLASWQAAGQSQHIMHQQGSQHKQVQLSDGSCPGGDQTGCCLVFQQQVLGPAGQLQAQVGPDSVQLQAQELWAALPGPGTFFVKVGTTVCNRSKQPLLTSNACLVHNWIASLFYTTK